MVRMVPAAHGDNYKKGGIAGEKLRQYIAQIEQLEREKAAMVEHIRDVFTVAKSNGFDTKIMRQVIKLRKLDSSRREEQEALLDTYMHALGMLPLFEQADEHDKNVERIAKEHGITNPEVIKVAKGKN